MSKLLLDPQILWVAILTVYVLLITFSLKFLYAWFVKKGVNKDKAIYYNRKLIHVFAGGVVAFMVPFVFTSPIYPLISGMFITFFTLLSHRSDRILYWFQTEKNLNDVSFCWLPWGQGDKLLFPGKHYLYRSSSLIGQQNGYILIGMGIKARTKCST